MKIPDFFYEQVLLGEKSKEEILNLYPQLHPTKLEAKLAELKKSNQEILSQYPIESFTQGKFAKILKTTETNKNKKPTTFLFFPAISQIQKISGFVAAACLVITFSVLSYTSKTHYITYTDSGILEQTTRVKGSPRLFVYRKEKSGALLLKAGTQIKQNDILQLSYLAQGAVYGAILSIDGNGTVTQHLPEYGNLAVQLNQKGETPLHYAYKLDNAPKFERFILITSNKTFSLDPIIKDFSRAIYNGYSPYFDVSVFLPSNAESYDVLFTK